ncbi:hypothetical protein BDV3_005068 [Batrachochytrium dendrobatidis]|uniref:ATP-dependent Clp protease, ATP-binding subunit ClpX n=1 Tax=Batrachochytrium dendrobatidis (strain JEL423) TaxID=403673 RepID=A0A177WKH1_BATDL|nr:ATP-dependent Clp protease, ATP-binding subunit ClpX [Batrachochytrium dendrobatidis JEL423]
MISLRPATLYSVPINTIHTVFKRTARYSCIPTTYSSYIRTTRFYLVRCMASKVSRNKTTDKPNTDSFSSLSNTAVSASTHSETKSESHPNNDAVEPFKSITKVISPFLPGAVVPFDANNRSSGRKYSVSVVYSKESSSGTAASGAATEKSKHPYIAALFTKPTLRLIYGPSRTTFHNMPLVAHRNTPRQPQNLEGLVESIPCPAAIGTHNHPKESGPSTQSASSHKHHPIGAVESEPPNLPDAPWKLPSSISNPNHRDVQPIPSNLDALESRVSGLAKPPLGVSTLTPRETRALLDQHVVGQERLKKALSVAIYNHYKRVDHNCGTSATEIDPREEFRFTGDTVKKRGRPSAVDVEPLTIDKSNILLLGPTGSGKTLIAKTVAKILNVPFSMNDATPFTQAGYVGDDVEVCIHRLLQNSGFDIAKAQRGIVFIDEIDKISRRSDASNPNQRDVSGEGVQQGLLRMLEGTVVNITVKAGATGAKRSATQGSEVFSVDTSNILFICSGAFVGLDKIVQSRTGVKGSIGFDAPLTQTHCSETTNKLNPFHSVEPDDLIKFGFIPEFIGRLPIIASSDPLSVEELERILVEPKNAIVKQYQEIFRRSNLELLVHPLALRKIATLATAKNSGARGLRRIIESALQDALYEYPGSEYKYIVLDEDAVVTGKVGHFKQEKYMEAQKQAGIETPSVRPSSQVNASDSDPEFSTSTPTPRLSPRRSVRGRPTDSPELPA